MILIPELEGNHEEIGQASITKTSFSWNLEFDCSDSLCWFTRNFRNRNKDVLIYETPPLEKDVEIIGPVTLGFYASSSAPDTNWGARLSDVFPDGTAWALCGTILRARFRESLENPTLLGPGTIYKYILEFWPTANHSSKAIASCWISPAAPFPHLILISTQRNTTGRSQKRSWPSDHISHKTLLVAFASPHYPQDLTKI
jgi:hypothetical protein